MNSPIATLDSRADVVSANAPRAEHVRGLHTITGQYLYDRFVGDHDGDTTRMGIVRYAVDNCDTDTFKKALKDMVAIAEKHGDAAKKTAQSHQTVMRLAYGAWKFASPHLNMLGADDKTGYQAMRVLGKQALEKAGRKWDGSKADSKADKEAARFDKIQAHRLAEIREANPQNDGESPAAWEVRCRGLLAAELAENEGAGAEKLMARANVCELADKVKKLCGDDYLAVLQHLLDNLPPEVEMTIG